MGFQTLSACRVAGALGAEIEGIDLSRPLDEQQFEELNSALLEHQVIFLREQHSLDDEGHLAFARRFGELSVSPVSAFSFSRAVHFQKTTGVERSPLRTLPPRAFACLNVTQ